MSVNEEKKFVIKDVFENFLNLKPKEEKMGKIEEHQGILWKIKLLRSEPEGIYLYFRLECLKPEYSENEWSINTNIAMKIGESEQRTLSEKHSFTQENMSTVGSSYIPWNDVYKYLSNGKLSVEFTVTINSSNGVDLQPKKLNIFDDDVAKKFSDVILKAGDQEFHVNKMYLSSHSTYFKSLFSGNFAESEKSIIELKDIDPRDFQNFLELIHGDSLLEDSTVVGILKLSDYFDAKRAIGRCERFLLENSKKSIKDKFNLAIQYKLEKLQAKSISELKTHADILSIVPEDSSFLDHTIWKELLLKYSRIPMEIKPSKLFK